MAAESFGRFVAGETLLMQSTALVNLAAEGLRCPTLTADELRFLHALHLRLLAGGSSSITEEERRELMIILADQREREGRLAR